MSITTWHESALRAHWGVVVSSMDNLPFDGFIHTCESMPFSCSKLSHATISCKHLEGFDGFPEEVSPSNY